MKNLPWLRLYTEIIDDEKLGLLAFEDRWHFVAILCLKGKGVLDSEPDLDMLMRKAALKMGLTLNELEKVLSRLARMGLIDKDTLQPTSWDHRQMQSDSSSERVRAFRERTKQPKRFSNVSVTAQDTDTDTDIEQEEEEKKVKPAQAQATTLNIPVDLLKDWEAIRKAKRAGPLTKTAIKGLQREADKAGISLEAAVTACVEASWQGFNADWYAGRTRVNPPAAMTASKHSAESFSERDARAKREAWEVMSGRKWPEQDLPASARRDVIEAQTTPIRRIA
jgi:DNA-binding transcriptional regulator YiaG